MINSPAPPNIAIHPFRPDIDCGSATPGIFEPGHSGCTDVPLVLRGRLAELPRDGFARFATAYDGDGEAFAPPAMLGTDGRFAVRCRSGYSGPVLVRVDRLGSAQFSGLVMEQDGEQEPALHAICVLAPGRQADIAVTVLTELAVRELALQAGDSPVSRDAAIAQINAANTAIGRSFGLANILEAPGDGGGAWEAADAQGALHRQLLIAVSGLRALHGSDRALQCYMAAAGEPAAHNILALLVIGARHAGNLDALAGLSAPVRQAQAAAQAVDPDSLDATAFSALPPAVVAAMTLTGLVALRASTVAGLTTGQWSLLKMPFFRMLRQRHRHQERTAAAAAGTAGTAPVRSMPDMRH